MREDDKETVKGHCCGERLLCEHVESKGPHGDRRASQQSLSFP